MGHVAAYTRAARARIGISGWGSWHGDPFLRWEVLDADSEETRKVLVDTHPGASRLEVVRMAFETAKLLLGLMDDRPAPVLGKTESSEALLAWLHDRLQVWSRRRRGLTGAWDAEYRFLLSALTHDPNFEPAARQVIRRAGEALATSGDDVGPSRERAVEALEVILRVRSDDHLCWTLLGMLQRTLKQEEDAILTFRRATALVADYVPAHRELGNLFLSRGDLRSAGAHLRKAGKVAPNDPEVQFHLGSLYLELRDRDRAARHLQTVLRLASGSKLAREASRILLEIQDGPKRRPTNALADVAPDVEDSRQRDRELISRMFSVPEFSGDDITSPGEDFLDRLDPEATHWNEDDTVWDTD